MTDSKTPEEFPDLQGEGALGWYKPPTNPPRKLHEGDDLSQQSRPSTTEPNSFPENQTENEEEIKPEEVELNQEFILFDPKRTKKRIGTLPVLNEVHRALKFASGIALKIGDETVPFIIQTSLSTHQRRTSLTPFHLNPNLGYQITNEDVEPATRKQKLEDKTWNEYLSFDKTPSYLNISSTSSLSKNGFTKDKPSPNDFVQLTEKGKESLDGLKLLLTFPEGTFISDWDRVHLEVLGSLYFHNFYPAETGPLPKTGILDSGAFALFVPPISSELAKITGMFVRVTNKSEKV